MTDSAGRTVDFSNTLVVMTLNVGSSSSSMEEVEGELNQRFRPELLNWIDEVIVFDRLAESHTGSILEIMLGEVKGRLQEKGMHLKASREVEEALIRVGFHSSHVARALQRAIKRQVEDQLADAIVHGTIKEGECALLFMDGNGHMKIDSSNQAEIFFFR